jgi:hypothetical protein
MLSYILISTVYKVAYFSEIIFLHHFGILYEVALVSFPPHEFTLLPCYCYQLYRIENCEVRVVSSGIRFVLNFVEIGRLLQIL